MKLYHSPKSLVGESPLDQGLHGVRPASPTLRLSPSREPLLQREQVSQVGRSDAVASVVHGLRSMGQREERTDRRHRRERFQEREREKGQREGEKCCLDEGRRPDSPNMVTLKEEVRLVTCHPWRSCVWCSQRHPDPLPRRGQAPCWIPQNMLPARVLDLLNR